MKNRYRFFVLKIKQTLLISLEIVLIIIIIISCEKKSLPEELPPITITGENTFGCYINDELFVPVIRRYPGPDGNPGKIGFYGFPSAPTYFLSFSAHRLADFGEYINNQKNSDEDNLYYVKLYGTN